MPRAVLALILCVSTAASAGAGDGFDRLKDSAEKFDGSLSGFLDRFVGECNDPGTARECKEAANEFRRKAAGKRFYFIIGEEQANLSPGSSASDGSFTINLTPIFAAGNYAVSHGAPLKADPRGNPIFSFMPIKGKAPDGMEAQRTLREVANRSVRVEVVFTPQGIWQLPHKGGGKTLGVRAIFQGIRATSSMSGEPIAQMVKGG
jgi:hypothetical protein